MKDKVRLFEWGYFCGVFTSLMVWGVTLYILSASYDEILLLSMIVFFLPIALFFLVPRWLKFEDNRHRTVLQMMIRTRTTAQQLSHMAMTPLSKINKVIAGQAMLTPTEALRVAKALGVRTSDIAKNVSSSTGVR